MIDKKGMIDIIIIEDYNDDDIEYLLQWAQMKVCLLSMDNEQAVFG